MNNDKIAENLGMRPLSEVREEATEDLPIEVVEENLPAEIVEFDDENLNLINEDISLY